MTPTTIDFDLDVTMSLSVRVTYRGCRAGTEHPADPAEFEIVGLVVDLDGETVALPAASAYALERSDAVREAVASVLRMDDEMREATR